MYSSITASSYPFLSFCFSDDGGGGCGLLSLIKKSLFCTLDITSSSSSWRPRRRFCGGTSTPTSSVLSTKVLKHELRLAEEKSRDLVEGKISFIGTKYYIEKIAAGLNEPTLPEQRRTPRPSFEGESNRKVDRRHRDFFFVTNGGRLPSDFVSIKFDEESSSLDVLPRRLRPDLRPRA